MLQGRNPLKKLSWKHKEVARRLILNQDRMDIAIEVGYAPSYIDFLVGDPLFNQEMEIMEAELQERFIQERTDAMEELHDASMEAAQVSISAMRGKMKAVVLEENEVEVPIPKRLECAWDVLDRTGKRAPSKSISVHASLQDLLIEAYEKRKNGGMKQIDRDNEQPIN
jgi:hypothetical protein